ncbi:MAG: glycosyltransferase, partial [Thermodesulfobacteriota bacterium]|nr:glycosyltransferase [Thermodesulfobacteriota bacterium]
MKKTISIIIGLEETSHLEGCLKSIKENTPESYEIIFIVRSSMDSPYKWIKKLTDENKDYHLIEGDGGEISPRDFNRAIKESFGEYIVLLSSDTIVTENWLSGMLEHVNRAPDIGIVGPMGNNVNGIQKVPDTDHLSVDSLDDYAGSFRKINRYRRIASRRINGFCMLFRRSLIDKIGLFDENLNSQDFMIDDFCLRYALDGYTNLIAGDAFVYMHSNKVNLSSKKRFSDKWSGIDIKSELGEKVLALNAIEKADKLFQKNKIDDAFETL